MSTQTATANPVGFAGIMAENKGAIAKIEAYRKTPISMGKRNLLLAGLTVGAFALIGMIGLSIITGVVAVITAAVGGTALWYGAKAVRNYDPVIQQKMKNHRLEMMVKEAQERAIYQLDNEVIRRQDKLNQAREARNNIQAQIRKLYSKVDERNKGKDIYNRKMAVIQTLEAALEKYKVVVDKMAENNALFETKVREHKDLHEFNEDAGKIREAFASSGAEKLEEMLSLEAFNAIATEFDENVVFIENMSHDQELDMALSEAA